MVAQAAAVEPSLKVFISYSRKDNEAAERVHNQLVAARFAAYLDKVDILPGEPWRERLGRLIEGADTVVFLVSPDSIGSEICDWEVNEAERLEKRILPVVVRNVPDEIVPGRLRRLNYVFLRNTQEEELGFRQLGQALLTDVAWIREHTRLGELAADWERGSRAPEFLLRGKGLSAAELWVSQQHGGHQVPTELHRSFILASRESEQARLEVERAQIRNTRRFQLRAAWALAGLATLVAAGLVAAVWLTRETAQSAAVVFSSAAQKALDGGLNDRAARIALLGLPKQGALPLLTPWSNELAAKLAASQIFGGNFKAALGHDGRISHAAFSPDGQRIVTTSNDKTAKLWDAEKRSLKATLHHQAPVLEAVFSHDGTRVVTRSRDNSASLWDGETGRAIAELRHQNDARSGQAAPRRSYVSSISLSGDGRRIMTLSSDRSVRIWDTEHGTPIAVFQHQAEVRHAAMSPNAKRVATSSGNEAKLWDVEQGTIVATLPHKGSAWRTIFSPDGRVLVTSSADGSAGLWNSDRGALIATLNHKGSVRRAVFSRDGRRILTEANEPTAKIWDSETGALIASFPNDQAVGVGSCGTPNAASC